MTIVADPNILRILWISQLTRVPGGAKNPGAELDLGAATEERAGRQPSGIKRALEKPPIL